MRITKKFTGEACIGKRMFHPVSLNEAQVRTAQAELNDLERAFLDRLREQRSDADRKQSKGAGGIFSRSRGCGDDGMGHDCCEAVEWSQRVKAALGEAVTTLEMVEQLASEGEAICAVHGLSCNLEGDLEDDFEDEDEDDDGEAQSDEDNRDSLPARAAHAPSERPLDSMLGVTESSALPNQEGRGTATCGQKRPGSHTEDQAACGLLVGFMESLRKRQATSTTAT
jgi:hypothetical protein